MEAQVTASQEETMLDSANRYARAAWSALAEPGDALAATVVEHFGAIEALKRVQNLNASSGEVSDELLRVAFAPVELPDTLGVVRGWLLREKNLNIEMELEWLHRLGGQIVVPGDASWPGTLDVLEHGKPIALWQIGNPEALRLSEIEGGIAMVGARASSRYGVNVAREIAYDLACSGCWIISGGAYGIDAASHQGALASSGKTICVQAAGLGNLYPAMNASLFDSILETGAVVSEVPCSMRPTKRFFLSRNRLISALSSVVVVVEAGQRSGALSTANHGMEQGREVAAIPGMVTSPASLGCHNLIREGATLVSSAKDILELARPLTQAAIRQVAQTAGGKSPTLALSVFDAEDKESMKVMDSLNTRTWKSLEQVARAAGLGLKATQSALGVLELGGMVETRAGRYRLAAA